TAHSDIGSCSSSPSPSAPDCCPPSDISSSAATAGPPPSPNPSSPSPAACAAAHCSPGPPATTHRPPRRQDNHDHRTTMTTHTVTNGPVRLHVVEEGNPHGPTLVLVHGWPDTHALWDRVAPLLADDFRILRYDNRGAGASTVPREVAHYRLEHLAADLHAVIDALAPNDPVHLLGHDWGAVLCWEAVCEPDAGERIASYTSISGPNLDHLGLWMRRRLR